ncbi:hypothetical protein RRG08_008552 [Elysia crispata]|uniref:Uncharacterized protein n=1 Tax=Elysia crispata TaxID=231223 RepID=A0AAE0YMP7_9GAST|nr:hypothetical protein RRG08_008552 [Elysia crispata]
MTTGDARLNQAYTQWPNEMTGTKWSSNFRRYHSHHSQLPQVFGAAAAVLEWLSSFLRLSLLLMANWCTSPDFSLLRALRDLHLINIQPTWDFTVAPSDKLSSSLGDYHDFVTRYLHDVSRGWSVL